MAYVGTIEKSPIIAYEGEPACQPVDNVRDFIFLPAGKMVTIFFSAASSSNPRWANRARICFCARLASKRGAGRLRPRVPRWRHRAFRASLGSREYFKEQDSLRARHGVERRDGARDRLRASRDLPARHHRRQRHTSGYVAWLGVSFQESSGRSSKTTSDARSPQNSPFQHPSASYTSKNAAMKQRSRGFA